MSQQSENRNDPKLMEFNLGQKEATQPFDFSSVADTLIRDDYDPQSINAHNVNADVKILPNAGKSVEVDSSFFTNNIEDHPFTAPHVIQAMEVFLENPSLLNHECSAIKIRNSNRERFKKIFVDHIGESAFDKYEDDFRETAITTGDTQLSTKGSFRIFSIYVHHQQENPLLIVFLYDPYHLVIPVAPPKTDTLSYAKKQFQTYCEKACQKPTSIYKLYHSRVNQDLLWSSSVNVTHNTKV